MKKAVRIKSMMHITRINQPKKHQHGWWVRIQRDGKMIQDFFSDAANGDKLKALLEAQRYRDELLRTYPKPAHGNMFNRPSARNTSKIVGVNKTRSCKGEYCYDVWQASWMLPNGKHVNRRFHFSPDGRSEREAKQLAIKAREEGLEMIARMRRSGRGKRASSKKAAKKRR